MSDLTYSELQNLTYDELSAKTYSLEGETGSGSNSSGGSCVWTESRIAAIENRLTSIESALAKLATSAELTSVKNELVQKCATAEGFATPDDVKLTTTTQTVDLSELKTYGDANWKTAEGFATTEEVASAANLLLSQLATSGALESAKDEVLTHTADLPKIHALLGRWSVSGNVLTTYDTAGNVLSVHSLTRDGDGNIVATQ